MNQMFNPLKQQAAHELAQLLRTARQSLGTRVQHWCVSCGAVNIHPSRTDATRCWRCGIRGGRDE